MKKYKIILKSGKDIIIFCNNIEVITQNNSINWISIFTDEDKEHNILFVDFNEIAAIVIEE